MSVYLLTFTLWIPLSLHRYLWLAPIAGGATIVASLVETPNVTERISAEADRFQIAGRAPVSGRTYDFTIDAHPFSHGVPVFVALVAASLGFSVAVRARIVAIGLVPLYLIGTSLLVCAIENSYLGIKGEYAPGLDRSLAPLFRAGTDAAEAFFGQFIAVVITFGAATTLVLRREARLAGGGPNAPCACGSGLKRKRCCAA